MTTLKKLLVFLLLVGFTASSYAAVDDVELVSCSVYGEAEPTSEASGEDEEPDCE